jgi:hypothetical protein
LHNPVSTHLTIKLFSASNLGTSTRRLTLAGDEDGISIGEHLKEVEDLDELPCALQSGARMTFWETRAGRQPSRSSSTT